MWTKWPARIVYPSIVVLAIVVLSSVHFLNTPSDEPAFEQLQPIARRKISGLGTIAPRGKIRKLGVPANFVRVGQLFVEEGDSVLKGERLAQADDYSVRESELRHAQAQINVARSRLLQLMAGPHPEEVTALNANLESAEKTAEQRQKDYQRIQSLAKTNSVSKEEIEEANLHWKIAETERKELEARIRQVTSIREEDVQILRDELKVAELAAESAAEQLRMAEIVAPFDGVILNIHAREGEQPNQEGILELGDTTHMQIVAEIYEADIPSVRLNANAIAVVKSTSVQVRGNVSRIRPLIGRKAVLDNDPISDTDARVVEVMIDVFAEDALKIRNLSNARVEVAIQDNDAILQ